MRKIIKISTIALLSLSQFVWAYHGSRGNILDENNKIVAIDGVNWAGFQDSGMVDELFYGWIGLYPIAKANRTIGLIDMLKRPEQFSSLTNVTKSNSVSFKTIRLPINPSNLRDASPPNTYFRTALTDAKQKENGNGPFCEVWGANECSKPLSVSKSLYKIIEEFQKNNIRVLIDFHQTPQGRNGNVVMNGYSLNDYRNDIAELVKNIKDKHLDNVIGIDVFNEPHNLNWFTANGNQPAWVDVIAAAAQAIYDNDNDSNLLMFVEGSNSEESGPAICVETKKIPVNDQAYTINKNACGNGIDTIKFKSNWGENFRPLLDPASAKQGRYKLGDELRNQLLKKLPEHIVAWLLGQANDPDHKGSHIVFSPHIYGKRVATWQSSPEGSPHRFNWNFGFLHDANYPVVIGETGYLPDQKDDVDFFHLSVSPYLKSKNMNRQLFYWTFNTSSSDTGGVRENADTAALNIEKESALHNLFYSN